MIRRLRYALHVLRGRPIVYGNTFMAEMGYGIYVGAQEHTVIANNTFLPATDN